MLVKSGTYDIDLNQTGHKMYRMHIFPFAYNDWLPHYYNNNQRFLQKHLPQSVFKTTKIFEKAEIKWVCIDELKKMRPQFRFYFRNIVDDIISQKDNIKKFIEKSVKKGTEKKTLKKRSGKGTRKNR